MTLYGVGKETAVCSNAGTCFNNNNNNNNNNNGLLTDPLGGSSLLNYNNYNYNYKVLSYVQATIEDTTMF